MEVFPTTVNDQLPKLTSLFNIYSNAADPAPNNDNLGENPTLLDVANFLGGRIEQVRQGQGVLSDAVAQNMKEVELHQRQITWIHSNSATKEREMSDKLEEVNNAIDKLKEERVRQYRLTCEMKQRSLKGNFGKTIF